MITVTFVCLGNICRSPMAEAVFLRLLQERNLTRSFCVQSFATSGEEEGNPVYPPVAKLLKAKGYCFTHNAQRLNYRDVVNSDYVLVMDTQNLFDVLRISGEKQGKKVYKLGSFAPETIDIADPWYTRDFECTYTQILLCCTNFLNFVCVEHESALTYDKNHDV